jgi:hypothetical protein
MDFFFVGFFFQTFITYKTLKINFLYIKFLLPFSLCIASSLSYAQAPVITSFSPASGAVGTLVTVTGANFNNPTDFTIGGVSSVIVSNSAGSIVGMVMPGSTPGIVSITTTGGTASGNSNFTVTPTLYPQYQQGQAMVGTGSVGQSYQGGSVSLSADGNTAIIGGLGDSLDFGAVWIFTRIGTTWTQQGEKLRAIGELGSYLGSAVALSADGNTAVVGGSEDNNATGAAWIFTRTGNIWTQQSPKLVGSGGVGAGAQGCGVALSADGNTALVGGSWDNNSLGATWVYTRTGNTWAQQGPKLVGTGASGTETYQGYSVALSADGNTALAGGYRDNSLRGAVWVFTRSAGTWTQQGPKLIGTGANNSPYGAEQGASVALSADGITALVGGIGDSSGRGAAWVFSSNGGIWTQQGPKLIGTGAVGAADQGYSVALSADGNTALVSGLADSSSTGATWVYTRNDTTWTQRGQKLVGTGSVGHSQQGISVALSKDGGTAMVGGNRNNNSVGATWVFCGSCYPNGIEYIAALPSTHLFPNPNRGPFTLQTSGCIDSDYTISDMLGNIIVNQKIKADIQSINLPEVNDGVYILTVKGSQPLRFIIMR